MEAALHLFQLVPYPRWRRLGSRNEWNEFHLDTGENLALSKMLGIWLWWEYLSLWCSIFDMFLHVKKVGPSLPTHLVILVIFQPCNVPPFGDFDSITVLYVNYQKLFGKNFSSQNFGNFKIWICNSKRINKIGFRWFGMKLVLRLL